MSLNERKSSSVTIVRDGRRKTLVLMPERYFGPNGPIRALGVSDTQEYLGLQFGWKGEVAPKQSRQLEFMLKELKEAPLKPYQRMEILRTYLAPKLMHKLVLGGGLIRTP